MLEIPLSQRLIINNYSLSTLRRSYGSVKIFSLLSEFRFDDVLEKKIEELDKIKAKYSEISHEQGFVLWSFNLSRKIRSHVIEGDFYVLQKQKQIYLITGEPSRYVDRCVLYLISKMYPDILIGYLTSEEIYNLLNYFSSRIKKALLTKKYIAKRMFGEKKETDVRFKSENFVATFKKVKKDNLWIDNIRVSSDKFDFRIGRNGILQYYRGVFDEYYSLLQKWSETCLMKYRMFDRRGRQENPERKVRPLIIEFNERMFDDIAIRKKFVETIGKYPFCSYSVVHGDNPHIYLTLLDRLDNSSFSIRTFDSNSLLLIPQIKATKAALMRFSNHLIENFHEGRIVDYNEVS